MVRYGVIFDLELIKNKRMRKMNKREGEMEGGRETLNKKRELKKWESQIVGEIKRVNERKK